MPATQLPALRCQCSRAFVLTFGTCACRADDSIITPPGSSGQQQQAAKQLLDDRLSMEASGANGSLPASAGPPLGLARALGLGAFTGLPAGPQPPAEPSALGQPIPKRPRTGACVLHSEDNHRPAAPRCFARSPAHKVDCKASIDIWMCDAQRQLQGVTQSPPANKKGHMLLVLQVPEALRGLPEYRPLSWTGCRASVQQVGLLLTGGHAVQHSALLCVGMRLMAHCTRTASSALFEQQW